MKTFTITAPLALAATIIATPALAENQAGKTPPGTTGPTSTPIEQRDTGGMGQGGSMGMGQPSAQVTEDELEKFADVQNDLQDITDEYQQKMQDQGGTAQDRMSLQQDYQREVSQAVNDAGLTPREYNEIQSQVMSDPSLQRRVQEMM